MRTDKKLALAAAAILALAVVALGLRSAGKQQVSTADPSDIVREFYGAWLAAAQSTSTDPYREGLGKSPILSAELRERLEASRGGLDPVLCQTVVPEAISTRRLSEGASKVEVLVTAKKPSTSTEQAVVALRALDGGWYVDGIRCSAGDFAPEPEFTFERDGHLKEVAPGSWHLVFEEDGQPGHQAPLLFGVQSVCVVADGSAVACDSGSLAENAKAHVRGQMTEGGVEVARLELVR